MNEKNTVPELTATQQKEFETKHGLDPSKESRLSLNGVNIITDEYFDDSPAMMRPEPVNEFTQETLKSIAETIELLKQIKERSKQ